MLMANPASAGSLLEQRLTEDVRVTDGLLSVKDPDELDLFILPANAPWEYRVWFGRFFDYARQFSHWRRWRRPKRR